MKYLLLLLVFLTACGSGPKSPASGGIDSAAFASGNDSTGEVRTMGDTKFDADTGTIAPTGDADAANNLSGTGVLFIGVFATWHNTDGDNFDGLYDSTQSLFTLCGSNRCQHVVASEIAYDKYASCDTTNHKRVMLFMRDSLGRLNPNGVSINVVGSHGYLMGARSQVIRLSPAAINRINATKPIKSQFSKPGARDTSQSSNMPSRDHLKTIGQEKSGQLDQLQLQTIEQKKTQSVKGKVNQTLIEKAATKRQH